MLFAVCQQGVQIKDRLGPLMVLPPPADPRQVTPEEVYVLFDEAPRTYQGQRLGYRREVQGYHLPQRLSPDAWRQLPHLPQRTVHVLICNGFGAGYGDALVGSVLVEQMHERIRAAGKVPVLDFLVHPYTFERERYFDLYKLNPYLHGLHFTTMKLADFLRYDYYASTEGYVDDPGFRERNVYAFFQEKLGLPCEPGRPLRLYPNPAVLEEVRQASRAWRAVGDSRPLVLVNFFASSLRTVPRFKWPEIVRALADRFRLAFIAEAGNQAALREFLAQLPAEEPGQYLDLSGVSGRGFDHLTGIVLHGVDAVLTPDTSLLHVCSALGKPCACIFFSLDPALRVGPNYPSVVPYCPASFRQSRFWGLSKVVTPDNVDVSILNDPDFLGLWRQVEAGELCGAVEEALALPRHAAELPAITWERSERPRVLVYTDTVLPVPTGEKADVAWLLQALLPAECEVDLASCRPLEFRSLRHYDLVLFGLGDCFYEPVLSQPGLARFLASARRCAGVFGLQYPASLPQEVLRNVLGALAHWFALYQRDLTQYGSLAARADWLGEPLLAAAPLQHWTLDRELVVEEKQPTPPLPQRWREVGCYRRVRCAGMAALTAALASAEEVSFAEPRTYHGEVSGRLGAISAEVLGQVPPEGRFFTVDRTRLIAYRQGLQARLAAAKLRLLQLLA